MSSAADSTSSVSVRHLPSPVLMVAAPPGLQGCSETQTSTPSRQTPSYQSFIKMRSGTCTRVTAVRSSSPPPAGPPPSAASPVRLSYSLWDVFDWRRAPVTPGSEPSIPPEAVFVLLPTPPEVSRRWHVAQRAADRRVPEPPSERASQLS